MKWWLISDEDVRKLADSMVIGPGRDWVGPNGQEEKQAFFDDMEHTLLTGLHETDAVPADFQPLVTVHAQRWNTRQDSFLASMPCQPAEGRNPS